MSAQKQRKPINYQNGKIYCITNTINDKIYIGSTIRELNLRLSGHKTEARKIDGTKNRIFYDCLRDNIDCFEINLIENFPCNNKKELEKREYEIINDFILKLGRDKLYNICLAIEGEGHSSFGIKFSQERKNKMSITLKGKFTGEKNPMFGTKAEKCPSFKYGCVEERKDGRYRFRWYVDENNERKIKSKSFSINKYGKEVAHQKCLELQKQIYPQLNNNNNEN